jgi:hypothetical protein
MNELHTHTPMIKNISYGGCPRFGNWLALPFLTLAPVVLRHHFSMILPFRTINLNLIETPIYGNRKKVLISFSFDKFRMPYHLEKKAPTLGAFY